MLWKRGFQVVIGLGLLGLTMPVWGQSAPVTQPVVRNTLPEMLPADTLLYIGWPGAEALAEANRATALGKLLAEPEIVQSRQKWREEVWPAIRKLILKEIGDNAQAVTAFEFAMEAADLCWRRPASIALVGVDMGMFGPMVDVAVIVDAGPQAADLAKQLDEVLKDMELPFGQASDLPVGDATFRQLPIMPAIPLRYGVYRDKFVVTLGLKVTGHLLAGAESRSLAESERFIAAMKYVEGSTSVPTGYLDLAGVVATLERFQPMFAGMNLPVLGEPGGVRKMLNGIGFGSVQSLSGSIIVQDQGYKTQTFIHVPGLNAIPDVKIRKTTISDADLAVVPRNVRWATVSVQDIPAGYKQIMGLLTIMSPEITGQVTQVLDDFEQKTGLRVVDDILGAFGEKTAIFDAPEHGGIWLTGMVIVAEAKKDSRLNEAMEKLVAYLAERFEVKDRMTIARDTYRGCEMTYLNVTGIPMPVAPAWTQYEGRYIVAWYPQMVRATLDHLMDKNESILANADFQRGRKLMPAGIASISYVDDQGTMRFLYSVALPLAQTLMAMGQDKGVPANITLFPSWPAIGKHMFGTVSVQVVQDEGMRFISHGVVPLGTMSMTTSVGVSSMMVSILLPSLARARELSKRTVSAANLAGIGKAMYVYANENDDKFPPSLQTLVEIGAISPTTLISPKDAPDKGSSYIYIEGQTTSDHYDNILIYEDPDNYAGEGTNVLFVDSHVEFMTMPAFEQALDKTKKRLSTRKTKTAEEK